MEEYEGPSFSFSYSNGLGKHVVVSFQAETWPEALSEFVQFLQGAGYILQRDSVGINSKNHIIDPDCTTFITTFSQ